MGRILLVRHGQASFGAEDYDVLSELGWEQGRALGRRLAAEGLGPSGPPVYVVRGDMRRHRETLVAIGEGAGWTSQLDIKVDPDWDEFDHVALVAAHLGSAAAPTGEVSDHVPDRRAFQTLFEQATARWTAGETDAGESYAAFCTRVRGALERAAAAAGPGRTVLVVTSGGVIAAAAAMLLHPDPDPDPDRDENAGPRDLSVVARLWSRLNTVVANASMSTVVVGGTGARLLTFNDHSHVAEGLLSYR